MVLARLPFVLMLALLSGCAASAQDPPPWHERTPAVSTPPKADSEPSGPTLGTPFYLWADALDQSGPASLEFAVPGEAPGDRSRNSAPIDHAELVLHSDGFVIALESMDVHLIALPGYLNDVHVRADGITSGTVLEADADTLHVDFDVRLVLDGTRIDDGTPVTVLNEQPTRLAVHVVRTGKAVQLSAVADRDAADWLIGASHVQGGPLALKLDGELISP